MSCFPINKSSSTLVEVEQEEEEDDVIIDEEESSSCTVDDPKRLLIVMDALKEFSVDLIECVLRRFASSSSSYKITLLGIKPWLTFTLSAKTWSDIWSMDLQEAGLLNLQEVDNNVHLKNDPRYHKLQPLIQVCKKYGVVPELRTEMGHQLRLRVAEQISSVHATLVVFDRHHDKKYIDFYAQKIPCNMFAVNHGGQIHLIKKSRNDHDVDVDDDIQDHHHQI